MSAAPVLSPDTRAAFVAALYIDPRGPYPKMPGVDAWDEVRDARRYAGPRPVVAHPPCGPWGQLRQFCTRQSRELAPLAVAQVRQWGGVLEHPRGSLLWRECDLPKPDDAPDAWGGWTLFVEQVAWGHACTKPTWLYFVGVDRAYAEATRSTGGRATHEVHPRRDREKRLVPASSQMRRRSPPAFAAWLVACAATATRVPEQLCLGAA